MPAAVQQTPINDLGLTVTDITGITGQHHEGERATARLVEQALTSKDGYAAQEVINNRSADPARDGRADGADGGLLSPAHRDGSAPAPGHPPGGHHLHMENADAVVKVIGEFLFGE
jgi:hypothetical protein